jgi:hypothetical protein
MLAEAAGVSGLGLLRDWYALASLSAGRVEDARTALGPWRQQPEVPPDYLWTTHLAIRAELGSALGSAEAAKELRIQLAQYEDRIAFGGTGITMASFLGHQVGLLLGRKAISTALCRAWRSLWGETSRLVCGRSPRPAHASWRPRYDNATGLGTMKLLPPSPPVDALWLARTARPSMGPSAVVLQRGTGVRGLGLMAWRFGLR